MAPILAKVLITLGTYVAEQVIRIVNEVSKGRQITVIVEKKEYISGDTTKHE